MSSLANALDLKTLGILTAGLLGILIILPLCLVGGMSAVQLASVQVPTELLRSDYFGPLIDPMPPYQPQTICDPSEKPGVAAFRDAVLRAYPQTGHGGIIRECSADGGSTSEHKEGRAWDWMVSAYDPEQKRIAETVINWLLATDQYGNKYAMARRLGIMYIIWDRQQWGLYRADEGWRPYTRDNPHTDHVHFSFYRSGALQQTTYWHPERSCDPPATSPPTPLSACGGPTPTPDNNIPEGP